jgi:hypothetical protein
MGREYKIICTPFKGAALAAMMRKLPSPIQRPQMVDIYNYRIDDDGYYLVDHLIDRRVAAVALQSFVDASLATGETAEITEP